MSTDAEMLAEVPLFAQLSESERALLAERIDVITVEAGITMFHHGDPGGTLYVVRSGEVELFFKNDTGERITLETVGAGEFFGDISLLDGGARTSAALVKERLVALEVDRGDLEALIQVSPASAIAPADGDRAAPAQHRRAAAPHRFAQPQHRDRRQSHHRDEGGRLDLRVQRQPAVPVHSRGAVRHLDRAQRGAAGAVGGRRVDPFPFGLLTMVVSLEAIILSVFVLLSQNRQAARERVRNEIEYQVNLKAELEIAHMHEKVDNMYAAIMARLDRDQRRDGTPTT